MKKVAGLLALVALVLTELAFASAVVTSSTGNVTAQVGSGVPRPVRTGDRLNQGDTVVTAAGSSTVMKFDDGQVAALGPNSRMTITAYRYDPASQRGSVLLSLISGAMRGITGMIGKNSPENVSVRAATATIGIRGTDFSVITNAGVIFAEVNGGKISFTFNGQTVEVDTGRAILTLPNGTVSQGTINQIYAALQGTDIGREIIAALGSLTALSSEINRVFPGIPTQGQVQGQGQGPAETEPGVGIGSGRGSPTGPSGGGGSGGGGTASPN